MENDNNQGGAAAAEHPLAGFAQFTADDLDSNSSAAASNAKNGIEKMTPVGDEKPAGSQESAGVEAAGEPVGGGEKGADEIKKTTGTVDDGLKKFEIPGAESPNGEQQGDQNTATVEWGKVAQDFGLDVPQGVVVKDVNDVKALYTKKIESLQQQAEANKQVVNKEEVYKQFTPEARQIVEFIDNGGELQDFLHPEQVAQEYLSMDNEALMRAELIARGIAEDKADAHVTRLIERGDLEVEADTVRAGIVAAAKSQQSQVLQQVNYVKQQKVATEQASETARLNSIQEALGKTTEFLGGKIEQAHKDYVFNEYKSGRTKKLLEDPESISEFLLFKAFGKQAFGEIKKTEYSKGRESIENNLFNTPPKLSGGTADRRQQQAPVKEGDFSAWGAIKN